MYSLERNWEMVEAATNGLDEATLARRPAEDSNSMAWIFGHLNRVTDLFIQRRLQSKAELWLAGGWCAKFSMTDAPDGLGMGQTVEQISAWVAPPWEVQLGYFEGVKAVTREYISSLVPANLEKQFVFPPPALIREHTLATAGSKRQRRRLESPRCPGPDGTHNLDGLLRSSGVQRQRLSDRPP